MRKDSFLLQSFSFSSALQSNQPPHHFWDLQDQVYPRELLQGLQHRSLSLTHSLPTQQQSTATCEKEGHKQLKAPSLLPLFLYQSWALPTSARHQKPTLLQSSASLAQGARNARKVSSSLSVRHSLLLIHRSPVHVGTGQHWTGMRSDSPLQTSAEEPSRHPWQLAQVL